MNKLILFAILLSISITAVALTVDIQADRYLIQVQKMLTGRNKDYDKAADLMDKIMELGNKHHLQLPIEFYFKYAKIYSKTTDSRKISVKANKAFTAINYYLKTTKKNAENYEEALEIYDWAASNALLGKAKNADEVKELIMGGANVNTEDNNNYDTPLHHTVRYNNNHGIVKALIVAGADVNRMNSSSETPLHYAARYNNNHDIIKALVVAGADVNQMNSSSETPLHYATRYNNNHDIVKTLIVVGADVNQQHLYYAIRYNTPKVIKSLIDSGVNVNVNQKYDYDHTPLYYATRYNTLDAIKVLVAAGSKDNYKDLLDTATRYNNNREIIKFLSKMKKQFDENIIQQFNQL